MFQKDAQTITPEALESVKAALASSEIAHKAETKKKAIPRKAAGQTWEDPSLTDWPESMTLTTCLFFFWTLCAFYTLKQFFFFWAYPYLSNISFFLCLFLCFLQAIILLVSVYFAEFGYLACMFF